MLTIVIRAWTIAAAAKRGMAASGALCFAREDERRRPADVVAR
jgi:hypothetical protein